MNNIKHCWLNSASIKWGKYHKIQTRTKDALHINDPERLVLLMHELDVFERELHEQFEVELAKEMKSRRSEEVKTSGHKTLHSLASLVIPYYDSPTVASEIVINGLRFVGQKAMAESVENKIEQGLYAFERFLEKMKIVEQQILLDFLDAIKKRYSEKLFKK